MSTIQKKVYTNNELRNILEFYNLNDDTIDSIWFKLNLQRRATYESGVNYIELEYKGYKYEIHGYLVEKRNDAELFNDDDGSLKEFKKISVFLEQIQDKEISIIEDYVDFLVNGEPDIWGPNNTLNESLDAVKWIDDTPNSIKVEFDEKYRDDDYREVIYDGVEDYDGEILFFEKHDNVVNIHFKIISKEINYEIVWVNKSYESNV